MLTQYLITGFVKVIYMMISIMDSLEIVCWLLAFVSVIILLRVYIEKVFAKKTKKLYLHDQRIGKLQNYDHLKESKHRNYFEDKH